MNKEVFINGILEKYKGILDFKYTVGSRGIHVEIPTGIAGITQYQFYKFEE